MLEINVLSGIELVDEVLVNWGLGFLFFRLLVLSLVLFSYNSIVVLYVDWLGEVFFFYSEKIINYVSDFCFGEGI